MKDPLAEIKQAEGGDDPDESQHRGNPQHHAHVPGFRLVLVFNVVIGDGQNRAVVEQRQHHDHHRRQGIEVENQNCQRHEEQHAQGLGDAVDGITVHPLENAAALLDRINDHGQTWRCQHNGGCRARCIRRTRNGDAAVGFLQRGSVIHPVACHADDVAAFLQDIHNVEFVFGKHLGETVSFLDGLGHLSGFLLLRVTQAGGIEDVGAHIQFFRGFLGNRQGISRHHLDLNAHCQRGCDGCLRIFARRIEQRQHAKKLPRAVAFRPRHAQRTKTARRKFVHGLLNGRLHLRGIGRQCQNHLWRTLCYLERLSVLGFDGGLGAFMHRVEWLEVEHLVTL